MMSNTKKENVIARKHRVVTRAGRRLEVTIELSGFFGQKPYFAATTEHGADHKMLLSVCPELRPIVDLHLSNEDGMPMHAVENGKYWLEQLVENPQSSDNLVKTHFRIDSKQLEELLEGFKRAPDRRKFVEEYVKSQAPRYKKEAVAALNFIRSWEPEYYGKEEDGEDDNWWEDTPAFFIEGDQSPSEATDISEYWPEVGDIYRADSLGASYVIAFDVESAQEAVRAYWKDMVDNDPKEFACIVGEKRLVRWGMGLDDKWGISSVEGFVDAIAENYAQELNHCDSEEYVGYVNSAFLGEVGYALDEFEGDDDYQVEDHFGSKWLRVLVFKQ